MGRILRLFQSLSGIKKHRIFRYGSPVQSPIRALSSHLIGSFPHLKPADVQSRALGTKVVGFLTGLPPDFPTVCHSLCRLPLPRWGGKRQVDFTDSEVADVQMTAPCSRSVLEISNHMGLQQSVPTLGPLLPNSSVSPSTHRVPGKNLTFYQKCCTPSSWVGAPAKSPLDHSEHTSLLHPALHLQATLTRPFLSTLLSQAALARVSPLDFSRSVSVL